MSAPGHVIYRGPSGDLGECLEDVGSTTIAELRISSTGGDVEKTLEAVTRDSIDLLIVEGLCASSCANYVVPAASRLIVEPDSYVLLHGSANMALFESEISIFRQEMRRETPELTEEELDEQIRRLLDTIRTLIERQAAFESQQLACRDWLRPHENAAMIENAPRKGELLATPVMANRCLRFTRIERFWLPADLEDLPQAIAEVQPVFAR